jgi:outer membrane protein assembly factor BamB
MTATRIRNIAIVCPLLLAAAASTLVAEDAGTDWPQWRGPDRSGVAPQSPPLIDQWPEEGPRRLWFTEGIPGCRKYGWDINKNGGSGTPSVAEGKVVVFVHRSVPRSFTVEEELLRRWGWDPDMPDPLLEEVEKVRFQVCPRHGAAPSEKEVRDTIEKYMAGLDEDEKKFASAIQNRLHAGRRVHLPYLKNLAKLVGKEFKSYEEMAGATGKLVNYHGGRGGAAIKKHFLGEANRYFDEVHCLDANSGKVLWKQAHAGQSPAEMHFEWPASSTPTISGGRCYVQGSRALYCLALEDGKLLWKQETEVTNASPLVVGDKVINYVDQLTAFDAKSGERLWRNADLTHRNCSPLLWKHESGDFLLVYHDEHLVCVRPEDGGVVWKTRMRTGGDQSPLLAGEDLVVARAGNSMQAYRLSKGKAEQLWYARDGNRGASPVVTGGRVFTQFRHTTCRDLKTGKEIWSAVKQKTETCSPIAADGKVITWTYHKRGRGRAKWYIVQFDASADDYREQGALKLDPAAYSSPVLADGRLYLRLETGVACYDLRKK